MLSDDELAAIAEIPLHSDVPHLVAEIRALRTEREPFRALIRGWLDDCLNDDCYLCIRSRAALDDRAPRDGG